MFIFYIYIFLLEEACELLYRDLAELSKYPAEKEDVAMVQVEEP